MARRFRFRLETVRKIRQQARDVQRRVVAEKARAAGEVRQRIARLEGDLERTVDRSREAHRTGRLNMSSVRVHEIHRGWLHRSLGEVRAVLVQRQAELSSEQTRLAEASKRLKVIEKLRERQWERYKAEVAKEEQSQADEVGQQRLSLLSNLRRQREHGQTSLPMAPRFEISA